MPELGGVLMLRTAAVVLWRTCYQPSNFPIMREASLNAEKGATDKYFSLVCTICTIVNICMQSIHKYLAAMIAKCPHQYNVMLVPRTFCFCFLYVPYRMYDIARFCCTVHKLYVIFTSKYHFTYGIYVYMTF